MKGVSTKRILIVAACLLGVGLLLVGAAFLSGVKPLSILKSGELSFPAGNLGLGPGSGYKNWDSAFQAGGEYSVSAQGLDGVSLRWIGGQVRVERGEGKEIHFAEYTETKTERSGKALPTGYAVMEADALRWGVEDGVLYIQHCAPDQVETVDKTLVLTLPEALADRLDTLRVNTISADVALTGITANSLKGGTTSGEVLLRDLTADTVTLDSVSGALRGDEGLTLGSVKLETTSGDLRLTASYRTLDCRSVSGETAIVSQGSPEKTELRSTSGDIRLSGGGGALEMESVSGPLTVQAGSGIPSLRADSNSGAVDLELLDCPEQLEVQTISGEVRATLPSTSGFTLKYETVSGDLDSDFPTALHKNVYVAGDGGADLRVETTSGSLRLRKGRG